MIKITINGAPYEIPQGVRLLPVLSKLGINIPHICFHDALTPSAACKLCVVEITQPNAPPAPRLSCAVKTQPGMSVITESAMIHKLRNQAIGNLLKMAPRSEAVIKIAEAFHLQTGVIPDGCIRCRLCVRVCKEIIGARAIKMIKKNGENFVVPDENRDCIGCGTCANICPTGAIRIEDKNNVRTILIREEVIGRHALKRCEICGRCFATQNFLQYVDRHATGHHPHVKEHHTYCATCAKLHSRKTQRVTDPVFTSQTGN